MKVDDLKMLEAEFAVKREKTKKEIEEKEVEEDELLREQLETFEHSRELKGGLGFCLHAQKDQIQIMSKDVQAACNETKGIAAVGKAASTFLKRITEDKEHKRMRGEISDVAIEFLSNVFLNLEEVAVEKIDIVWITGTFGTCKHGKLALATFRTHFIDPKDTEAKLSRKLFEVPETEIKESGAKQKTEAELLGFFCGEDFTGKGEIDTQIVISIFH